MNVQNTLFQAVEFANWAHRNQKRKLADAPYVVHPFHVMLLLLTHGITPEPDNGLIVLVAGVLHDTLEDNPEDVTFDLIREKFGLNVAETVKGVTLDPSNPDKRLSREKIIGNHWGVRIVKVADVLSNTMSTIDSIKRQGFAEVQRHFKQPIAERMQMEREFLEAVLHPGDFCPPLVDIRKNTLEALDELEVLLKEQ